MDNDIEQVRQTALIEYGAAPHFFATRRKLIFFLLSTEWLLQVVISALQVALAEANKAAPWMPEGGAEVHQFEVFAMLFLILLTFQLNSVIYKKGLKSAIRFALAISCFSVLYVTCSHLSSIETDTLSMGVYLVTAVSIAIQIMIMLFISHSKKCRYYFDVMSRMHTHDSDLE